MKKNINECIVLYSSLDNANSDIKPTSISSFKLIGFKRNKLLMISIIMFVSILNIQRINTLSSKTDMFLNTYLTSLNNNNSNSKNSNNKSTLSSKSHQYETETPQSNSINSNNNDELSTLQSNLINPLEADKSLERIKSYIVEFALTKDNQVDLFQKQIITGNLPNSFPKEMIQIAKQKRHDTEITNKIMKYPTVVWRGCLYPNYTLSFVSYCRQKYSFSGKTKLKGCYNNFCMVCCDTIINMFTNIANIEMLARNLNLDDNLGREFIKTIVSDSEVKQCRLACKNEYKINMPVILPTPPRDKLLGVNINNPAISCSDIKTWGNESNKSGEYWLDFGQKGKQKVYCDLETDNGGWTLFYNYVHKPNMDMTLDATKLPHNLQTNSHMNLADAGFNSYDVKEIRFYCTEKYLKNKLYWHFKTSSPEFVQSALTGDMTYLKANSLSDYYTELNPTHKLNGIYQRSVFPSMIEYFSPINREKNNGFTNTPFGSYKYKRYWTIKGNNFDKPKYECGTEHNYLGGLASTVSNPNMVDSHHTIWFKGKAPSKEQAQRRFLSKMRSSNFN